MVDPGVFPFDISVIILEGRSLSWSIIIEVSLTTVFLSRAEWSICKFEMNNSLHNWSKSLNPLASVNNSAFPFGW
jgi:hypothetical protein